METMDTQVEQVEAYLTDRNLPALRQLLTELPAADIAELFEELPEDTYARVFRILPKDLAAEAFTEMDPDLQEKLIGCFSDAELKAVLDEMYIDDTVGMIEEMPANVVRRILRSAGESREAINELLKYPEDSAGRMMVPDYIRLNLSLTVAEAYASLRRQAMDKETVYTCYVTDSNRRLLGYVEVSTLLCADETLTVGEIMDSNVVSVNTLDDREIVAQQFEKYHFPAMPVVDTENRLVGLITFDDAMDALHSEVEEDFAKMAAITPTDTTYLKTPVLTIWKTRIPWLMLLMISATFTGLIISRFEGALASQVVLTAFIPMLMDTGGNSGSQASVTVIRGLSLGELSFSDILSVVWKEVRVSLLCGLSLATVTFGKILLVDRLLLGNPSVTPLVAFAVCLTLCVTVFCAKLIGCSLPMLAKKIGFDPAVMASPFITTIVDAVSLIVYFGFATMLLKL